MNAQDQLSGPVRVVIDYLSPEVDRSRFPAKRAVGENVVARAHAFGDGHDEIRVELLWRRFLTDQTAFRNLPAYGGSVDWLRERRGDMNVGILLRFVPNEGDAWKYTLNCVERSISAILATSDEAVPRPPLPESLLEVHRGELSDFVQEFVGPFYLEMTRLLGQRTAKLHEALAGVDQARIRYYMELWCRTVAGVYLESYRETAGNADFVPVSQHDFTVLLETFLLEKALYEVGYELNNRPGWLEIPLWGIIQLLERSD